MVVIAILIVIIFTYTLRNINKCNHDYKFIRKTSGDENNRALDLGGRYIHKCSKCDKYIYKNE